MLSSTPCRSRSESPSCSCSARTFGALIEKRFAADAGDRPLGVVRHRQHAISARLRGSDHFLEARPGIAGKRGVQVEVAVDLADRKGERPRLRGLDLAGVFPEDRRNPRDAESGVVSAPPFRRRSDGHFPNRRARIR